MSTGTGIQWTQATWNPVVGCTRASAGCDHCYAVTMTHRLEAMGQPKYAGLTVLNGKGDRHFNGVVRCVDEALTIPLGWRKPRRVFVNSMSDLFHREVPFEFVDRVFAVMALTPQHTYQILTKRPERMAEYLAQNRPMCLHENPPGVYARMAGPKHPLPNVWLGTSVEDQDAADKRIPHLLRCPAAVRFLSVEPMLGPVDLSRYMARDRFYMTRCEHCDWRGSSEKCDGVDDDIVCPACGRSICGHEIGGIGWVIVGGESGHGARPCDVAWIRSIVQQCKAAGTACFVKQLGANVLWDGVQGGFGDGPSNLWPVGTTKEGIGGTWRVRLSNSKGGDPSQWPEDIRVREMPAVEVPA